MIVTLAMVEIVGDCKHYRLLLLNLARSYSLDLMRVDVFVVLFPKSFRQQDKTVPLCKINCH